MRKLFFFVVIETLLSGGCGIALAADAHNDSMTDWVSYRYEVGKPSEQGSNASIKAEVVWLPSEHGLKAEEKSIANQLSQKGYRVTIIDPFETLFLPPGASALRQVKPAELASQVEPLRRHAPLFIIASNQASALALAVIQALQSQYANGLGVVLINPNLYTVTPVPGNTAQYREVAQKVDVPVYVLQSELSPWRWRLQTLQTTLGQGGSDVFLQVLAQVRDRFYFRPDAKEVERARASNLADDLHLAMVRLAPYLLPSRGLTESSSMRARQASLPSARPNSWEEQRVNEASMSSKPPVGLAPYQGDQGKALDLVSLQGERHRLTQYRGKVVLLNFWASWCPPCVHEMPSMAQLKTHFDGQPFEILAANLAESSEEIRGFLSKHPVNFTVLMDPKGVAVKDWQVYAYPSSYLIDVNGTIRYALFGGYDWDSHEARETIRALIQESSANPSVR